MSEPTRDRFIDQGLAHVHTGLGILLTKEYIGPATHKSILSLLKNSGKNSLKTNQEADSVPSQSHGQTSASQSMGIERDLAGLIFSPELTTKQPAVAKPGERGRHQATDMSRTSAQQSADPQSRQPTTAPAQGQGPKKKIICPWWATEGYYCKNAPRGLCPFIHGNSVGAVRQPLICSFWADGDRCRKSAEECSFAHYATEHRQIAPLPKRKN